MPPKRQLPEDSEPSQKRIKISSASQLFGEESVEESIALSTSPSEDYSPHDLTNFACASRATLPALTSSVELQIAPIARAPTCYRLQNIPSKWTSHKLWKHLRSAYPSLKIEVSQISLFPCCFRAGKSTALLKLEYRPDVFENGAPLTVKESGKHIYLGIDREFYGLTPLNAPKDDVEIVAELVFHSA